MLVRTFSGAAGGAGRGPARSRRRRAGACRRRIGVVKFLAPLLPEQDVELRIARDGARVRFRIERDGTPILSGEGELE